MLHALGKPDRLKQPARPVNCARLSGRNERRRQNIFQHRTLRQQAMVLKDEADFLIPEGGKRFLIELKWIAAIERDAAGRCSMRSASPTASSNLRAWSI